MKYLKKFNESENEIDYLLETEVRTIFVELEDSGLSVEVFTKIKPSGSSIKVIVHGEEKRKLIGDTREYFEMFKDYISDKYTIKDYTYIPNYISNEVKNIGDPYQYIMRTGQYKQYPEDLKNIVNLILKIEFE